MPGEKSFWETVPGILTGIAGLLGAVATLLTALFSMGYIGNHPNPKPADPDKGLIAKVRDGGNPKGGGKPENNQNSIRLANTSFRLPGDGQKNNNQSIGPFCCTGETVTIQTNENIPVGYIYFYDFEDAVNVSPTKSAAGKIKILVSGPSRLSQQGSQQVKQQMVFAANNYSKGQTESVQAGELRFVATLENAVVDGSAGARFDMTSFRVRVDVQAVGQ